MYSGFTAASVMRGSIVMFRCGPLAGCTLYIHFFIFLKINNCFFLSRSGVQILFCICALTFVSSLVRVSFLFYLTFASICVISIFHSCFVMCAICIVCAALNFIKTLIYTSVIIPFYCLNLFYDA